MFKLQDLIVACSTVTAPPQQVGADKRKDAEEYLLEFRRKASIQDCGDILRNCQDAGVQFQAAVSLKSAFARESVELTSDALIQLAMDLLQLIEKNDCTAQVREQLVMIVAIAVKRNSGQNNDSKGLQIVQQKVQEFASSNQSHGQVLAASLICAVVQEYSGTGKSSVIGLSLEGHQKAKKYYENNCLSDNFTLVMKFLGHLIENPQSIQNYLMVKKFLEIGHLILSWRFTHGKASRISLIREDKTVDVMFNPPESWKGIVTSGEFLKVWFATHGIVRRSPELGSISSSCIQQICSMKGTCLHDHETEAKWAASMIELFQGNLPNWMPAQEHESTGLSYAFKHFIENRSVHIWMMIESYFPTVLSCLAQWTCSMIENAKKSEEYQQGLDFSTDAWIYVMTNFATTDALANIVSPNSLQVWKAWVWSKLSPPDGERIDREDDDDEIDELEEDDAIVFDTQLAAIGNMARLSISDTMTHLGLLLSKRLDEITSTLKESGTIRTAIWEDIHWIMLSVGHMLADETDAGEMKYIPQEIMSASLKQNASSANSIGNSQDITTQLIGVIFKVMELEKAVMEANIIGHWSPQASEDLRWLLQRVAEAYLWFEEDHFKTVSPAIQSIFGRDTASAQNLLNEIVEFSLLTFSTWSGEEKILTGSAETLMSLLKKSGKKAKLVGENMKLWSIAEVFCREPDCGYSRTPVVFQRNLMKVILTAGSSGGLPTLQKLADTIKPLQARFARLANASFENQMVRNELVTILERLTGCVEGVTPDNADSVAEFVLPFIQEMPAIVQAVRGSSDISIQIFTLCASIASRLLAYLEEKRTQPFLLVFLEVLKTHSRWNQGRNLSDMDDETVEELTQIISLITKVLDVEVFDFTSPAKENKTGGGESYVTPAEVSLAGLTIVLPLMGTEGFNYPSLAIAYFDLLNSLCELYPEKLAKLPENLFTPFMQSLQLGITHFGTDAMKIALESIEALSNYFLKAKSVCGYPENLGDSLISLMPYVFDSLLKYASDYDMLPICLASFLHLATSFPGKFRILIQERSGQCTDNQKQRIQGKVPEYILTMSTDAFKPVMEIINENQSNPRNMLMRRHFHSTKLLETAVFEIRGLLCMK